VRVLLTGAGGFLGRYVHQSLTARGIETIALGRTQGLPGGFIAADLLNPSSVESAVAQAGATHLVHLAWYVEHGKFWQSPLNADWVDATAYLAEAFCKAGGRRVVAAGTCFEYAQTEGPAIEDVTPVQPRTPYGIAKDEARSRVMAACARFGASCAWGRIFVPYGTGENAQRLLPSLIAALTGSRPAFGVNRPALRDFINAADLGEAFAVLAAAEESGPYNISTGEGVKIETVVREVAAQLGADPAPILDLPSARPGEPAVIVGDCRKLEALGWRPRVALKEGVARMIARR
jgi:nucleoside-diphosphate-sugar epimerase